MIIHLHQNRKRSICLGTTYIIIIPMIISVNEFGEHTFKVDKERDVLKTLLYSKIVWVVVGTLKTLYVCWNLLMSLQEQSEDKLTFLSVLYGAFECPYWIGYFLLWFLKVHPTLSPYRWFFFSIANDTLYGHVFKKMNWGADALVAQSFLLNAWWTKEKEREKFGERER